MAKKKHNAKANRGTSRAMTRPTTTSVAYPTTTTTLDPQHPVNHDGMVRLDIDDIRAPNRPRTTTTTRPLGPFDDAQTEREYQAMFKTKRSSGGKRKASASAVVTHTISKSRPKGERVKACAHRRGSKRKVCAFGKTVACAENKALNKLHSGKKCA